MPILCLKRHHVNLLREEARRVHPIEACAMLFGELTNENAVVSKVVITPNVVKSAVRFEIDPEIVAEAFAEAEKEGLSFVGLFHSHPAPSTPSTIDLEFMKLWGDAVWLILSSTTNNLAAYQMKESKLKEMAIKVE